MVADMADMPMNGAKTIRTANLPSPYKDKASYADGVLEAGGDATADETWVSGVLRSEAAAAGLPKQGANKGTVRRGYGLARGA